MNNIKEYVVRCYAAGEFPELNFPTAAEAYKAGKSLLPVFELIEVTDGEENILLPYVTGWGIKEESLYKGDIRYLRRYVYTEKSEIESRN